MVETIVVFGHRGWIASYLIPVLEAEGFLVVCADVRADDAEAVETFLDSLSPKPGYVLSLIGRTHGGGINTIDYLEQPGKLVENLRDNLFAPWVLEQVCVKKGLHFTYFGTGCIFCNEDPANSRPYTEEDDPDFFGSSYSIVKGFTDRMMRVNNQSLNVRIRMPIVGDLSARNFVTKIVRYDRVCSIPNSMSVLPTLFPALCTLIRRRHRGTVNLVNPGCITHNEILGMYRDIVDPTFTWKNFTLEEQNEVLASKRSNNVLSTRMLLDMCPNVPDIHTAVREMMVCMKVERT